MKTTFITILLFSLVTVAAQTNTPPAAPDRFQTALTAFQTYLNGALMIVAALLGWWAQNRAKLAALVPPLVKSIQVHGTQELKDVIKDAAGDLGIEPAMNAAVKANTTKTPELITKPIPIVSTPWGGPLSAEPAPPPKPVTTP